MRLVIDNSFSELLIIGGGPSGLSAAIEAGSNGVQTTIIDKDVKLGGQYYCQPRSRDRAKQIYSANHEINKNYYEGASLIDKINESKGKINAITNACVWGMSSNKTLAYIKDGRTFTIKYKKLILAGGALERSMPFLGWTLLGILTAGWTQKLLIKNHILPGNRLLLSGCGLIQLALADQLILAGAKVVGVLESASALDYLGDL